MSFFSSSRSKEVTDKVDDGSAKLAALVQELEDNKKELATCQTEMEGLRQRLTITTSNCSLLEGMIDKRDATISALREQIVELQGRQTDADLYAALSGAQQQVQEKNTLISVLKEQLHETMEANQKLEHQLAEVARARAALHGILQQQMGAHSDPLSSVLPIDPLAQLETHVLSAAQRVADFVQRSFAESQARIGAKANGPSPVSTNESFHLQTLAVQDVRSLELPMSSEMPREELPLQGEPSGSPSSVPQPPTPDFSVEDDAIAVRSGKKRRKPGKSSATVKEPSTTRSVTSPCNEVIIEECSVEIKLQASGSADDVGPTSDEIYDDIDVTDAGVGFTDTSNMVSTPAIPCQPSGPLDLDDQWKDIADWLMEAPTLQGTGKAVATKSDHELEVLLYQQQLRATQEQLADLQQAMNKARDDLEQRTAENITLAKTVDALARRLEEALCQREEVKQKLCSLENFWGPAQPGSPEKASECSSDASSDGDQRPSILAYCDDPDPSDF